MWFVSSQTNVFGIVAPICHTSWRNTELQLGICPRSSSRSTRNLELALNPPNPTDPSPGSTKLCSGTP